MPKITSIRARELLNSRGHPTLEADVVCEGGLFGRASVPSGASTGKAEARELLDGDPERYDGRGVSKAVENVRTKIAPALIGMDPTEQQSVDDVMLKLDGSKDKSKLGANAVLAVSLACAHAAAQSHGVALFRHIRRLAARAARAAQAEEQTSITSMVCPARPALATAELIPRLPLPMINMISGGQHAGRNLDFQDFLIMPLGADSFRQALEWSTRVYRRLGSILEQYGYRKELVGEEGGYGPKLASGRDAAHALVKAIEAAKLRPGEDVALAIDVASSQFFRDGRYHLKGNPPEGIPSEQMVDVLAKLVGEFPIVSIEDGLAEEDWAGWRQLSQKLGRQVWLVGDDLFATRVDRVARGIQMGVANSVLIKVNQVGTLSETLRTMAVARLHGYALVVSARSGETEDTTIADLAVGTGAGQIKIGSIVRGERLAKYNRLLRIEEELELLQHGEACRL